MWRAIADRLSKRESGGTSLFDIPPFGASLLR